MYDSFDDCFYPAEENYHEDQLLQDMEREYFADLDEAGDYIPSEDDGDYDDLLDELDFPF